MKVRAICPECGTRVPSPWFWDPRGGIYCCPACRVYLRHYNVDRQPYTTLIGLIVLSPVFGLIGAMFWLSHTIGLLALPLPLLGLPLVFILTWLQFPYTNRFEVWYPRCIKCKYDMRSSQGTCPECGGQRETPPG